MFTSKRILAVVSVLVALVVAGPVTGASASQVSRASQPTAVSYGDPGGGYGHNGHDWNPWWQHHHRYGHDGRWYPGYGGDDD